MKIEQIGILLVLMPLLGFLISSMADNKNKVQSQWAAIGTCFTVFVSLVCTILLWQQFFYQESILGIRQGLVVDAALESFARSKAEALKNGIDMTNYPEAGMRIFTWFKIEGDFTITYKLLFDELTLLMCSIVTGIGLLIHIYSIGYMKEDDNFARFMSYLNLFIFFMLVLVTGANYLLMFVGWEGVGLCSYLLIGFWYKNMEYNKAANKAFIMNRIGDVGMLLAMFLLFNTFNSLDFVRLQTQLSGSQVGGLEILTTITVLLFIGATGKSAQLPLFTWLPDAMAGPTPVSALIHAATMVTAGIYMIIRSNFLFVEAPYTSEIITYVGLATALIAATIGLKQNDIKKVLAYSTVSQLGYMFFALGLGAYSAAFFHVFTHAFFKALLFLGSGSVIHAMSGEQDIRKMGGLAKNLKITHTTFLIGTLAIAGLPPLAGFFSKDAILMAAFAHNPLLWVAGIAGACMTAFYMFRLYFLTFHGEFRGTEVQKHHLHESPATMTIPLVILAIASAIAGFINVPSALGGKAWLDGFLDRLIVKKPGAAHHLEHSTEYALMGLSVVIVLIMIFLAYRKYKLNNHIPIKDDAVKGLPLLLANKYYLDEIYNNGFVKPLLDFSLFCKKFVEEKVIDGAVNGVGKTVAFAGNISRQMQTGHLGFYLLAMVISIVVFLVVGIKY